MPLQKTSEAEYKSIRFNPKIHPQDKEVLNIVKSLEERGYSFKEIVVDAILRADGKDPVTFQYSNQGIVPQLEEMFSRFAQDIINHVKVGGAHIEDADEDGNGKPSPFAERFTHSFLQRQQRGMGDEE
jgi:hypothetical protein